MPSIRIVLSLVSLFFVASCKLTGESENTILREVPNPNRTKKAILFIKKGGATVADSYQLTISEIGYELGPSDVGNAFITDDNHSKTNLDSLAIVFSWLSVDSLAVNYNEKLRTFIQKSEVKGVRISYEAR